MEEILLLGAIFKYGIVPLFEYAEHTRWAQFAIISVGIVLMAYGIMGRRMLSFANAGRNSYSFYNAHGMGGTDPNYSGIAPGYWLNHKIIWVARILSFIGGLALFGGALVLFIVPLPPKAPPVKAPPPSLYESKTKAY